MIEYRGGNVVNAWLRSEVRCFAHQCNCFNTMGAGVAKEVKQKIPALYQCDQQTNKGDRQKLGTCSVILSRCSADPSYKFAFNLYGQFHYGFGRQQTDYDALRKAIQHMKRTLGSFAYEGDVGIPRIGCGLAGGDWGVVSKIIEEELCPYYKVIVYSK